MTLVGFLAADYVILNKNLTAWFFLIVASAIGFYAIPVMLYPCGLVFVWLFLTGLTKGTSKEYSNFRELAEISDLCRFFNFDPDAHFLFSHPFNQ